MSYVKTTGLSLGGDFSHLGGRVVRSTEQSNRWICCILPSSEGQRTSACTVPGNGKESNRKESEGHLSL